MAANRGLGKGLSALLGDAALKSSEGGTTMLRLSEIEPNLDQPRKDFDEQALNELSESIKTYGLLQPLAVRRLSSGYYQIIAGERRWRASRMAGLKEVPAVIFEADDRRAMEMAMVENLQRQDLDPIEEAGGLKVLIDDYGLTQEEVAERVGRSRPAVANSLRLLNLPDGVKALVKRGELSAGHARALISLPAARAQELAKKAADEGLSVRQVEKLASEKPKKKSDPAEKPLVDYYAEAERELSRVLNRGVKIVRGGKKGKIELEYYGQDDLNALYDLLKGLEGELK